MLFPGDDPKPCSPSFLQPESDDLFDSMAELPADPLLDPGAFINTATSDDNKKRSATETEALSHHDILFDDDRAEGDYSDNSQRTASSHPVVKKQPSGPSEEGEAAAAADGEFGTPVYVKRVVAVKTPGRRGRRKKSEMNAVTVDVSAASSEIPDWLPSGWFIEDRVRASGASAGARDKYYCDPVSGKRFRSRKEVLFFQETGGRQKRLLKDSTTDDLPAPIKPRTSSRKRKEKNVGSRIGNQPSNFDFVNVPEAIGWVLTDDSLEGLWTPFVGSKRVPENRKNEWAATFTSLSTTNSSC